MLYDEFDSVANYFQSVIREEINNNKKDHSWLTTLKSLTDSKIYRDGILDDIRVCRKSISGKNILDFGTGSGLTGLLFAYLGYQVKAIDIDDFSEKGNTEKFFKEVPKDQKAIWRVPKKIPRAGV